MNRSQTLALAGAIQAIHNDWSHGGIISQITKLDATWTGTDEALFSHAMAIAASPAAQTPGALTATRPRNIPDPRIEDPLAKEPRCFICGNPKSICERQQDFEIAHGLDPHAFETSDEALANTVRLSPERKAELSQQIRTLIKRVDDVPGMKHAVEAAKLTEEREQEMLP